MGRLTWSGPASSASCSFILPLAIGWGGWLADRRPEEGLFYRVLAWAGTSAGLAIVLARLLLRPAAAAMAAIQIGPVVGSFVAALALLAAPVILLGSISPFALRLALDQEPQSDSAGDASGRIYSASSLGSLLGTFLPPLLLIPGLGARLTYWLLAALLLVVALALWTGRLSLPWTIMVVGLVSLGAEVSATRLLGPVFGDSNLVWAAVIGVNMAGLAVGYAVGGRLADWVPRRQGLVLLLVAAAITAALAPLLSATALEVTSALAPHTGAGFVLAVTAAAAILFGLPVVLMGSATPYAIRLLLPQVPTAGGAAGSLYAVSTAGSLLGAYLPVLWLIPRLGTASSLLILGATLLLVASGGLLLSGRPRDRLFLLLPLLLIAAWPLSQGTLKATPGQLYETESAYNYIEVVERDGVRYLLLNEGQGVHSVYDPAGGLTHGTWDFFLAAPFFNPAPTQPGRRGESGVGGAGGRHHQQAIHRRFWAAAHRRFRNRPGYCRRRPRVF